MSWKSSSNRRTRGFASSSLSQALIPVVLAALVPAMALGQAGTTVLHCAAIGIGGDNASIRGIRFHVSQSFTAVEVHIEGSAAGGYSFDVELRRSTGYVDPIEATATVAATLAGTPGIRPYQAVRIDFPQTMVVSGGVETFTLKAVGISGPGAMYWEVAGIGNFPCPEAEVTDQNNVANPTMRTSANGLKVLDASGTQPIGTNYCVANANSTGQIGAITATGSADVVDNDVTLHVANLPSGAFLYFLVSSAQAQVNNPGGSLGNLCLGGSIGRFVGPGQILQSDAMGAASLVIDLTVLPQPGGLVAVTSGETWNFQSWHRDLHLGGPVSNFTDATSVMFL